VACPRSSANGATGWVLSPRKAKEPYKWKHFFSKWNTSGLTGGLELEA